MADHEIREAARAVERSVRAPDFGDVVARGRAVRRRRRQRQAIVSAAVVVLVGAAVAMPWSRLGQGHRPEPATPPGGTDDHRAALVLSDPDAVADADATWVSDRGAVLQRVSVSSPVGGRCDADTRTALVWHGPDGQARAWASDVAGRSVHPAPGGFVVGAPSAPCARALDDAESARGAYTVDGEGATHDVDWSVASLEACSVDPGAPGCVVDASSGTGLLEEGASAVPNSQFVPVDAPGGPRRTAMSTDGRVLAWTRDGGRSWDRYSTTLQASPGDVVQATAAGAVGVFFAWPRAEVTRDAGRSWRVLDLEQALAPVLVANPVLSVTADGVLAGVSYPTSGRPFVFAATDATWTRFTHSDLRTARGDYDLRSTGAWLWTVDDHSAWVSHDGLTWREVDALASPGSG